MPPHRPDTSSTTTSININTMKVPVPVQVEAPDDADIAAGVIHVNAKANASTNVNNHIDNSNSYDEKQKHKRFISISNSLLPRHSNELEMTQQLHYVHTNNNNIHANATGYINATTSLEKSNTIHGSGINVNTNTNTTNNAPIDSIDNMDIEHQSLLLPLSTVSPTNKEQILVLGINITHLSRQSQFIFCATGVFSFSLLYGYLQELISVSLCNRQLGLFLAMMQFLGYTMWSKVFHLFVQGKQNRLRYGSKNMALATSNTQLSTSPSTSNNNHSYSSPNKNQKVSFRIYLFLSILRAIDASMTNMAMAYVNYPAKTLMKSSRVVFTMLFGSIIRRKKYKPIDYLVVSFMVSGLALFMHADSQSSAVFQPIGIIMLIVSLTCDGMINNMSEAIMIQHNIGQDEFIYNLYSTATCGLIVAAVVWGDFKDGIRYSFTPGTWDEIQKLQSDTVAIGADTTIRSWNVVSKMLILILFSSAGFFGSSCSALITKEFGALTMSITSTARKAMTLFLSFALFNNVCTLEHVSGIFLFITALVAKSLRVKNDSSGNGSFGKRMNGAMVHAHHEHDDNDADETIMTTHHDTATNSSNSHRNGVVEMGETPKHEGGVTRRLRRRREHVIANIV